METIGEGAVGLALLTAIVRVLVEWIGILEDRMERLLETESSEGFETTIGPAAPRHLMVSVGAELEIEAEIATTGVDAVGRGRHMVAAGTGVLRLHEIWMKIFRCPVGRPGMCQTSRCSCLMTLTGIFYFSLRSFSPLTELLTEISSHTSKRHSRTVASGATFFSSVLVSPKLPWFADRFSRVCKPYHA